MEIKNKQRGFALLIAVIFMSVMLSFGLTLGSLGYKQQVLASSATQSQYAFYVADAALECALYSDSKGNYAYPSPPPSNPLTPLRLDCRPWALYAPETFTWSSTYWTVTTRVQYNAGNKHCADVTVYKYKIAQPDGKTTYIFSQGYDVPCSTVANPGGARFVSRGLSSKY